MNELKIHEIAKCETLFCLSLFWAVGASWVFEANMLISLPILVLSYLPFANRKEMSSYDSVCEGGGWWFK